MSVILPSQVSPTIILGNSTLGGVRELVDRVPGHGLRGEVHRPGSLQNVPRHLHGVVDALLERFLLDVAHSVDVPAM